MTTDNPQDALRIGNAERDEAVRMLRQQADAGRLDTDELAERAAMARAARTRDELRPAFADLPVDIPTAESATFAPYPAGPYSDGPYSDSPYPQNGPYGAAADTHAQVVPVAAEESTVERQPEQTSPVARRVGGAVLALLWPAAIILNIVFGWHLWWLFLIPVFGSGWIAYAFGLTNSPDGDRSQKRRDRDERRHGLHG